MADERSHVYELIDHQDSVVITLWWDGKAVVSDNEQKLNTLKNTARCYNASFEDGPKWLDALPQMFKSGYLNARKVKE